MDLWPMVRVPDRWKCTLSVFIKQHIPANEIRRALEKQSKLDHMCSNTILGTPNSGVTKFIPRTCTSCRSEQTDVHNLVPVLKSRNWNGTGSTAMRQHTMVTERVYQRARTLQDRGVGLEAAVSRREGEFCIHACYFNMSHKLFFLKE